jgi:hypothetical protein
MRPRGLITFVYIIKKLRNIYLLNFTIKHSDGKKGIGKRNENENVNKKLSLSFLKLSLLDSLDVHQSKQL